MASYLSPVMSIAGSGILPNPPADIGVALTVNPDLAANVQAYRDTLPVQEFRAIVANASPAYDADLRDLAANTFPALTDHTPPGYSVATLYPAPTWQDVESYAPPDQVLYLGSVYESVADSLDNLPTDPVYWDEIIPSDAFFSDLIMPTANRVMGDGDLSVFCQAFMSAVGYSQQTNGVLSAVNSAVILDQTFDPGTGGMDTITTANFNQVSTDLRDLSRDLQDLGQMIYLGNLDDLGLPGELLAQIGRVSGGEIPSMTSLLQVSGFSNSTIRALGQGINDLTSREERTLYQLMLSMTDDILAQVKEILGIRTANIINVAQLLDPRRILPRSYQTLICPTPQGLAPVYIDAQAVNSALRPLLENPLVALYTGPNNTNSLTELSRIIPPDQALANKALSRSLQQIKNIATTTLPRISRAMGEIETNQGLLGIQALTQAVPTMVTDFYAQSLGQGTGAQGDILVGDVVGIVSGQEFASGFASMAQTLATMQATGQLVSLTGDQGVYQVMADTQAGDYTQLVMGQYRVVIPPPLPAAGTYGDYATAQEAIDDAFLTGLIPAANTAIQNIVAAYPQPVLLCDDTQSGMAQELDRQSTNLALAQIDFNTIEANSTSAIMSFTANLHEYALDIQPGGASEILTAVSNIASLSGQAVTASLREGRNIQVLQGAGIEVDTQLPG